MSVELVANEANDICFGITFVNQPFQLLRAVNHRPALSDFDMPPTSLRLAKQEKVGCALTLVFKVIPFDAPHRGWDRRACFGDQLFALFIKTDFRALGIVRLVIKVEHIFHSSDELRTDFRDAPLFFLPRFEFVFFRYCRTASCEREADKPNSTTLSANNRSVQRRRPAGALLQATAIRCASA